jgi:lysophospholipase L1-like esterase
VRLRRVGAGVGGLLVLVLVVLVAEAIWVLSRDYLSTESARPTDAEISPGGPPTPGPPLRLVVVGDSTGAGVGASRPETTVGARLAVSVAEAAQRGVSVRTVAVSGARAADLAAQVDLAVALDPAVVVVLIGANDATHLTARASVRRDVGAAVRRLREAGAQVVVGTCPDLGGATAFPQPLRELAAWRGRAVGATGGAAVRSAGGSAVDLGAETGPAFRAQPEVMLSSDRFHPSDAGYALWARALAPATIEAAAAATAKI